MAEKKTRGIVIGVVFGIVGVVVGAVATGLMNAYVQQRQQRIQATVESLTFEIGNYPLEVLWVKQFIDGIRYLSIGSSGTIAELAELARKYPKCHNNFSDECRLLYVEVVRVMRRELGSGAASAEDIEVILRPKLERAREAVQKMHTVGLE